MVRFATEEWDIATCTNYDNPYMHLTNYAINKDNGMIIPDDPHQDVGHKRLLSTVYEVRFLSCLSIVQRLEKEGVDIEILKEKIDDIIVKTLISIQPELTHYYRTCQPSDLEGMM